MNQVASLLVSNWLGNIVRHSLFMSIPFECKQILHASIIKGITRP